MRNYDRELLNYLRLAAVSAAKSQPLGRDRFLILAGAAACRAGLLNVAARCRELVLQDNPRHLVGHYETFPDAVRDEEFTPLLKSLERLCPPEQAEYLLRNQSAEPAPEAAELDAAQTAGELLDAMEADRPADGTSTV